MTSNRVSKKELERLKERLSKRDIEILHSVRKYYYLTTLQICRLHWSDRSSDSSALRATHHALQKLRGLSLLEPLKRRIGGVRGGSGTYVWSLGHVGARLLADNENSVAHKRYFEPSLMFLSHTLAVAETALLMIEAARRGIIVDLSIECEPDAWRLYVAASGVKARIKPDLAITTTTKEYEDYWFIEVDLATEPVSRIIRTCRNYCEYRRSGEEQKRHGVFPAVVWVVPTQIRKDTLKTRISKELTTDAILFTVILMDELEALISTGPPGSTYPDNVPRGGLHV